MGNSEPAFLLIIFHSPIGRTSAAPARTCPAQIGQFFPPCVSLSLAQGLALAGTKPNDVGSASEPEKASPVCILILGNEYESKKNESKFVKFKMESDV